MNSFLLYNTCKKIWKRFASKTTIQNKLSGKKNNFSIWYKKKYFNRFISLIAYLIYNYNLSVPVINNRYKKLEVIFMLFNATGYAERSTLYLNKDKSFHNNVSHSYEKVNQYFKRIFTKPFHTFNLNIYYGGIHTKFW